MLLTAALSTCVTSALDKPKQTLIQRAIASLRARGADAHLWLPGVGTLSGLQTGNYLESTGNTLATVDNPTGLVLDALGTVGVDVVNNTMDIGGAWTNVAGVYAGNGESAVSLQNSSLTVGRFYKATFTVANYVSGTVQPYIGLGTPLTTFSANGTYTVYGLCAFNFNFYLKPTSFNGSVSNISVREVSGIHLTQGTTANKPVLRRGAVNLLVQSENLSTWTSIGCAVTSGQTDPQGGTTAFKLVASTGGDQGPYNSASVTSGVTYTPSVWLRADAPTYVVLSTTAGGFGISNSVTTTWTKFSETVTASGGGGLWIKPQSTTPVYVWHPQFEVGSTASAYSPTTTAAASNPDSGKYSWSFDGSNDSLLTGNLGITNACTIVIAGRLDSLAAVADLIGEASGGVRVEVGLTGVVSFDKYAVATLATTSSGAIASGETFVLTCRLSGGVVVIRKNGVQIATAATAQVFSATTGARIGTDFDGSSAPCKGSLGNVLAMPVALTDAECLLVERMAAAQFPNGPVF